MSRHVAILLCDEIEAEKRSEYGDFDKMFQRVFFPEKNQNLADPSPPPKSPILFSSFQVFKDQFPSDEEIEQWGLVIISGSRWGVYDEFSWLNRLNALIQKMIEKKVPMIGICFGHQAIAHALGGKIVKYEKGWHLGMQPYTVDSANFDKTETSSSQPQWIPTMHQDQIIKIPSESRRIATNDFCKNAGLIYPKHRAISFQFHIEYPTPYLRWALEKYTHELYSQELATRSLRTCQQAEGNNQHGGRLIAQKALEALQFV